MYKHVAMKQILTWTDEHMNFCQGIRSVFLRRSLMFDWHRVQIRCFFGLGKRNALLSSVLLCIKHSQYDC